MMPYGTMVTVLDFEIPNLCFDSEATIAHKTETLTQRYISPSNLTETTMPPSNSPEATMLEPSTDFSCRKGSGGLG
jgi:hypothetical protein